jgi:alpha-maltose-1-phosphate synthase
MTAPNAIAIYYHPDGYEVEGRPLMGRRAAGKSLLQGFFRRAGDSELFCCANRAQDFAQFEKTARAAGANGALQRIRLDRIEEAARAGTLYYPGPDISLNAWRRYRRDPRAFSLMGVTHTICTKAVMDGIGEWLTAPVEDWDAVICTSQSVRQSVEYALGAHREHLARRLGATRFAQPRLPVIPLGINTQDFAADENQRIAMRAQLKIGDDDIVALFVGRLSTHGKAHPASMFIGLQRAAQETGKRFHLLLCGWFASKAIEAAYLGSAALLCPDVTVHLVDGRDDVARNGAWRAGDLFVSLVDNIQETFGLTPVEAMAAGLPCVVSDWDGYRDTVRHGVDGFRVPTLMAPPLSGEALVDRYAADIDSYDIYLARSAYLVSVDIAAATQAFVALARDGALRKRMGDAGRARAVAVFDWQVVLQSYEELSATLAERRAAAAAPDPKQRRVWPQRLSPFEMFANFTTRMPSPTDLVAVTSSDQETALRAIESDALASLDDIPTLLRDARAVLSALGQERRPLQHLLAGQNPQASLRIISILLRLHKFGIVSIRPADGAFAPRRGPDDTADPA